MKIDSNNLKEKVKPECNNIYTYLDNASSYISSVSIPTEFAYYYKLTKMPENIKNVKSNIKNIDTWISGVASKFEAAENANNKFMNSLLDKMDKIGIEASFAKTGSNIRQTSKSAVDTYKTAVQVKRAASNVKIATFKKTEDLVIQIQSGINRTGAKIGEFVYNFVIKPIEYIYEKCKAAVKEFISGLIGEMLNGINEIKKGMTEFVNKGWKKACEIKDAVVNGFEAAGAYVSSTWDSLCTNVFPNIWNVIQSAAASVANVVIGLVKGLAQFVESVLDLVVMVVAGVFSIGTGIYDGISYLVSLANGTEDEWSSATGSMWKGVMGYVAEDYVGNALASWYEETMVGQWLDEHAIDIFKSDGIGTNIAAGIGYVAGIIILTIVTLGAGGAAVGGTAATSSAFTMTSAGIATTAGIGQYTEEAWGNMRDSSWEGIERMYERGEITEEELNSFMTIRNLTDEQWAEIEEDYKNGVISEEEFEQIKQIKEMPDDWKTLENGLKGAMYGVANGVWEGVQWYVGGKLGSWTLKGASQLATSAIRVGVDTAFNGIDTVFRTAMDSVTYGNTWNESWQSQGGWQSVLTSIGVGLISSAGGEVFDNIKINKAIDIDVNNQTITNIMDSEHGFQLNEDDLGGFFKAKHKQGFFSDEQINNMLESVNSKGYIDENTGRFLKSLFEDENSTIYIKTINSKDANSIMDEGIRCLGSTTSGYGDIPKNISDINLDNTVTNVTDGGLYELITRLKGANGLSQGGNPIDGAIIIKVPKDTPIENIFKYNDKLGLYNIDPKYNVGFIGCDSNGVLDSSKIPNTGKKVVPEATNSAPTAPTFTNVDENIRQNISNRGWTSDTDYRFQYQEGITGSYGCDQGAFRNLMYFQKPDGTLIPYNSLEYQKCIAQGIPLSKKATKEYFEMKNYFINKYNMSNRDASTLLGALDSVGACSYASEVNDLIAFYSANSTRLYEFETTFGFPLYKQNSAGVLELNTDLLLADMFLFNNHYSNGGNFFYTDVGMNTRVDYNNIARDTNGYASINDGDLQKYMMQANGMQEQAINAYLKSKGSNYQYTSGCLNQCQSTAYWDGQKYIYYGQSYSNEIMQGILDNSYYLMQNDYELQLYVSATENASIRFIDMDANQVYLSTSNWKEGGAHAVKITGMISEGFIVSSWGKRLVIPFVDLQQSGAFTIFAGKYE